MPRRSAARWQPSIGGVSGPGGTTFRVWAPTSTRVDLVVEGAGERPLESLSDGTFVGAFPDLGPGTRYRYRLDGDGPFPDPASRCQPDGVHGPSLVVDPSAYRWSDAGWSGVALEDLVFYELHVGTFTPEGTFAAVAERLPYLVALGVTALELMPVAQFPGARNWGYDGAALFAPARSYGTPADLRRLVDAAHAAGLAVFLDVVYNHAGPDGCYLSRFSPYYFTSRHASPWGAGIDLDGDHSLPVREFFIENALHWVHEYHVDGLRLDATHAIEDSSPRHFLAELTARVHASVRGRRVILVAEDHRNLAVMATPSSHGGWGLDAVWADDFHHQMRRLLAGDRDGYYRDYEGTTRDVAETICAGWFYHGQRSEHLGGPRGTDSAGLAAPRFVYCLQNHDQIGNRAFGERLSAQIDRAAFRAATVVLLLAPETPLLFMGQEWGAQTPFLYFTDHHEELGRLVTEGRRREFQQFDAFTEPAARARIPDPQAAATFEASRLDWDEAESRAGEAMVRLHRTLLALRREDQGPDGPRSRESSAFAADADTLVLRRAGAAGDLIVVVRLRGGGVLDLSRHPDVTRGTFGNWTTVLTTEDLEYCDDAQPIGVDCSLVTPVLTFARPGAAVLRVRGRLRAAPPLLDEATVGERVA